MARTEKFQLFVDPINIDAPLTQFPVKIILSDIPVTTMMNAGPLSCLNGGGDIAIGNEDLSVRYPLEVVRCVTDAVLANQRLELHTALPSVSDTAFTGFWVHYGDAAESQPAPDALYGSESVWDSDYILVSHDGGATNSVDSTSGTEVGTMATAEGIEPNEVAADFGTHTQNNAWRYTGLTAPSSAFTMEALVYMDDVSTNDNFVVALHNAAISQAEIVYSYPNTGSPIWTHNNPFNVEYLNAGDPVANEWMYVAITKTGNTSREIFENGVLVGSDDPVNGIPSAMSSVSVGWAGDSTNNMNGLVAEVRVSVENSRSAAWQKATSANIKDHASFFGVETTSNLPVLKGLTKYESAVAEASYVLNKPSGGGAPVAGDLLLLIIFNEDNTTGTTFNALTGWSKLDEVGSATADVKFAVYYRFCDETEGSSETITVSTGTDYGVGFYCVFENVDPSASPVIQQGTWEEVSTGSSDIAVSLTTGDVNMLALAIAGYDGADGGTFSISGTGWPTSFGTNQFGASAGTSAGVSGGFVMKDMESIGATQDVTFGASLSDGWVVGQIAIQGLTSGIFTVPDFVLNDSDVTISGSGFEASIGGGTIYISDADTLAGSANEVDITGGVISWNDTTINFDLTDASIDPADLHALLSDVSDTAYVIVLTDGAAEYSKQFTLTRPAAIVLAPAATAVDGVTTQRLTGLTGTFAGGRIEKTNNPSLSTTDVAADGNREDVWSIEGTPEALTAAYEFRVVYDGIAPDTVTVTPQVTFTAGGGGAVDVQGTSMFVGVTMSQESLTEGINLQGTNMFVGVTMSQESLTQGINLQGVDMFVAATMEQESLTEGINLQGVDMFVSGSMEQGNLTIGMNIQGTDMFVSTSMEQGQLTQGINLQGTDMFVGVAMAQEEITAGADLQGVSMFVGVTMTQDALTQGINLQGTDMFVGTTMEQGELTQGINLQGVDMFVPTTMDQGDLSIGMNIQGTDMFVGVTMEYDELNVSINLQGVDMLVGTTMEQGQLTQGINLQGTGMFVSTSMAQEELTSELSVDGTDMFVSVSMSQGQLTQGINLQGTDMFVPVFMDQGQLSTGQDVGGTDMYVSVSMSQGQITQGINLQGVDMSVDIAMEQGSLTTGINLQGVDLFASVSMDHGELTQGINLQGVDLYVVASVENGNLTQGINLQGIDLFNPVSMSQGQLTTGTNLQGTDMYVSVASGTEEITQEISLQGVDLFIPVSMSSGALTMGINLQGTDMFVGTTISLGSINTDPAAELVSAMYISVFMSDGGFSFDIEEEDEGMTSLTEVASFIENNGLGIVGEDIYLYHMPATVNEGILIKSDLTGMPVDPELPNYYDTNLQVIIRSPDHSRGALLAKKVNKALTLRKVSLGVTKVNYLRPRHLPVVYPRSEGGHLEFSTNFDWNFTFSG